MSFTRLLILITIIHHSSSLYEDDTHIAQLTTKNIDNTIPGSNNMWIVNFYSSRCRHSISAAPVFSDIAEKLHNSFQFGAVDCIREKEVCFRGYGIYSFPTIGFLYEDTIINYLGDVKNVENVTRAAHHAFRVYEKIYGDQQ